MLRLSVWMIRTALLYLGTGFTIGMLMLANKGVPFWPDLWRLLPIHIECLLFGWMLQLALGAAAWIVPRFSREPRYGQVWLGWAAYALLNAGVLAVAFGSLIADGGAWLIFAGRVAEGLAALLFVLFLWPRIKPLSEVTIPS